MNVIGKRIRALRQNKKLSQKDFGKLFDLAESTIGMYERDERKPDYETLSKFADYFDVSTDYLLGRPEKNYNQSDVLVVAGKEIDLTAEELELFNELKKHPVMFHDLASNPEKSVKEFLQYYKMKKMFLEDEEEEYGDGFGELED